MTAQIGDIYKYKQKDYRIVALSAGMPFDPKNYGLESHSRSTDCYRGYWCEYAIEEDILLLKSLFLFNKDGNYPPLNGIEVAAQEYEECMGYKVHSDKLEKLVVPAYFGHRVYRNVDILIPYTGKILLGDGFMWEYYIHMGFQGAWAYEKLLELVFDKGILVECNDLSHYAKTQRQVMKAQKENPRYPDGGNIPRFVGDSFSLDYSDKVWWEDD